MTSRFDVERAVMASELSAPSRLVMFVLCAMSDAPTGIIPAQFTPSLTTLAARTNLDRSTVRRALNKLEKAGWVIRIRPDIGKARKEKARTCYQVVIPEAGGSMPLASNAGGTVPPELEAEDATARGTEPPYQSGPYVDQSSSDDHKPDEEHELLVAIVDAVRERTGVTIDPPWAAKVRDCILEDAYGHEREVHDRKAYILAAIRAEPDPRGRFLPSIHATPEATHEDLPPWCGQCGDLGADSNPAESNSKFRYLYDDEGRPGPMCACHPDHPSRKDPAP